MAHYLLIESKSPWMGGDTEPYRMARDLARQGHEVTVYLVQNGVLAARTYARDFGLGGLGATVLADDFSLRERAIGAGDLRPPIKSARIERVVELIAAGARAVWH